MSKPAVKAGASAGRRPAISVCMMVKNEEKRLPAALASVKDWVDEIIVVDTGSTDRTVEIAESFGAKIYHHPWEYDFAKHRNQTLQYATGDWLFVLDADEELDQASGPVLRTLAEAPPNVHCFLFELYNSMPYGGDTMLMHPRLFRNRVGFHYQGKVHNRPMITGPIVSTKVKLYHYGYNEDTSTMEAKHERRVLMIRKWVEDEPESYHARSYLAHTLQARPETLNEAIEQALIGLELIRKKPALEQSQFSPHLYYPLLNSMAALGRDDDLLEHAGQCLELAPNFPDVAFFICMIHFKRQDWQKAYEFGAKFLALQEECALHPEQFVFYENLTLGQISNILMRVVVACAHLGKDDEAAENFAKMYGQTDGELYSKMTVQNLLAANYGSLAHQLTTMAMRDMPVWPWPHNLRQAVEIKSQEEEGGQLRKEAEALIGAGNFSQALPVLLKAEKILPGSDQVMLGLARAYLALNDEKAALPWLVAGLNAHPGHPWAWKSLADYYFKHNNYASALACYKRYLQMARSDAQLSGNMEICAKYCADQLSVRQKPPKLLLFMVNGLSHQLVQQPAPHFLMGKAWGEFMSTGYEGMSDPLWGSLMTGAPPLAHGIMQDSGWESPLTLHNLKVLSIWEMLPAGMTVGLAAMPLALAPLNMPGWLLPGYHAGILKPEKVEPSSLTGVALAYGYRSDYILTPLAEQTLTADINGNIIQEAFMLQQERNKIIAAMNMPAVDVLVIGFNFIEYQQRVHGLAQYNTFSVYQQLYGWIETTLATLQPENFAILSQRGYTMDKDQYRGGFYALSWLKGENGQAEITDVPQAILRLLGGDTQLIGAARQ